MNVFIAFEVGFLPIITCTYCSYVYLLSFVCVHAIYFLLSLSYSLSFSSVSLSPSFSLLPLSFSLSLSLPSPSLSLSLQVVNVKINCVRRRYKMAYIPSGFWSRLISRLMINLKRSGLVDSKSSCLSDPNMIYWRRGILIIYPSGRFLVEAIQAPLPGSYCRGYFFGCNWMH